MKLKKIFIRFLRPILSIPWLFGLRQYTPLYIRYLKALGVNFTGKPAFISYTAVFDGAGYELISIGHKTVISDNVQMLVHDYSITRAAQAVGKPFKSPTRVNKPIQIGNNVFVGMRTILLPGATINDNVIIGAGSVVTGEIPSNTICAGNPARVIRSIEEHYKIVISRDSNYIISE